MTRSGGRVTRLRAAWPRRRVGVALASASTFAVAVGVPTGLVPTPLYTRMTPVLWWNVPIWAASAVLAGLVTATYVRRPRDTAARSGAAAASSTGLLTALAVGCPVCNKLVVTALGASGAMSVWAPAQPVLGILSLVGLLWVLRRRLLSEYACPVRATHPSPCEPDSGQLPPTPFSVAHLRLRTAAPEVAAPVAATGAASLAD